MLQLKAINIIFNSALGSTSTRAIAVSSLSAIPITSFIKPYMQVFSSPERKTQN